MDTKSKVRPGLKALIQVQKAHLAPAVFNPLCAKIAQAAGFDMLQPTPARSPSSSVLVPPPI